MNSLLVVVVVVIVVFAVQLAACNPIGLEQHQSSRAQQQLQQQQDSVPRPQRTLVFESKPIDALIADGLGLNLIRGGAPSDASALGANSYYTSAKRARKLSAFMPMRGRKDGRDEGAWREQQARDVDAAEQSVGRMLLESLLASEAAARASGASVSELSLAAAATGAAEEPSRRFARQLLARHQGQQQQQEQHYGTNEFVAEGGPLPAPAALMMAQQPVMEAKLRRAFHPMRGKKWAPAGDAQQADEDMVSVDY